jgi:hypothetical protein
MSSMTDLKRTGSLRPRELEASSFGWDVSKSVSEFRIYLPCQAIEAIRKVYSLIRKTLNELSRGRGS